MTEIQTQALPRLLVTLRPIFHSRSWRVRQTAKLPLQGQTCGPSVKAPHREPLHTHYISSQNKGPHFKPVATPRILKLLHATLFGDIWLPVLSVPLSMPPQTHGTWTHKLSVQLCAASPWPCLGRAGGQNQLFGKPRKCDRELEKLAREYVTQLCGVPHPKKEDTD